MKEAATAEAFSRSNKSVLPMVRTDTTNALDAPSKREK
jgi:hypothetical protein